MASVTLKQFPLMGSFIYAARAKPAAQDDYSIVTIEGTAAKGVMIESARLETGAAASILYGTVVVNNGGTAYTASTTSIAYDGASLNRSATSFYVQTTSGEILEVTDSAPTAASGTLTVLKRGCLGTTASATGLANDAVLYVLNVLQFHDNQTDPITLILRQYPAENNAKLFA